MGGGLFQKIYYETNFNISINMAFKETILILILICIQFDNYSHYISFIIIFILIFFIVTFTSNVQLIKSLCT